MCGIAGIFDRSGAPPAEADLRALLATMTHRGPDSSGVHASGPIGLAHARLAILDLSPAGAQPMSDSTGTIWVIHNGEIYNFASLRDDLISSGCSFRSRTDTEVIVQLYAREGVDGLSRLDGMFAFALWDDENQRLILARDRTGKKPLFVYDDGSRLVFASELKTILATPGVRTQIRSEALAPYLTYGYVPTPETFYENVSQIPPATIRVIERDRDTESTYWDYPMSEASAPPTEEVSAKEVRRLLTAAVEKRLVSDVPLGAFLSGGVDSTLIVGLMSQMTREPVRTFSIGFAGDDAYDETAWARRVAERFGTRHTEFRVEPEQIPLIEKMVRVYDEPFGDSSALPTYLLSELTRSEVTVALSGDGGDELFAGYDRFVAARMAQSVPRPLGKALAAASKPLPTGGRERGLAQRAKRFLAGFEHDLLEGYRRWVSLCSPEEVEALLGESVPLERIEAPYRAAFERVPQAELLNQLLYANAHSYLLDDLNVKTDRASMAHGLEVRAPFLDTALMEYVFPLPATYKIHGTSDTKWILRRAFSDLLPADVAKRPKMGFGVPLGTWFRTGLRDYLESRLRTDGARLYGLVRREAVESMLDEHMREKRDRGQQLWLLLMLELWLDADTSRVS